MALPADYEERVYAGVLGKIIGVYLGRPFEGWSHERIVAQLGEIRYYVHERLGLSLVVADDDISGTFTFLRALADNGHPADLRPAQIGEAWLNYLVENRAVLWWGGMGNSTEHTAYLRLKHGVPAPESGSAARNGRVVSEQIGAQIFIDGWAMVAPGDPERAADLAGRAARVSHDGLAVHAAQVVAAMEAQAFIEGAIPALIDTAAALIPADSLIRRLIGDIRDWCAGDADWRRTRQRIAERYGYDRYGGNCHVVPNHALIQLALLAGGGDFQQSLAIVNTCGWDTDCNSGNVGCLLGIRGGLPAFEGGPDWRGPVADRLYLPSADGGRAVTDALTEAERVVAAGRILAGVSPAPPKGGARFHFDLPGAIQGFRAEAPGGAELVLENVAGRSRDGRRSLALRYRGLTAGAPLRAATPTFLPPETLHQGGYGLLASPTLYPGQVLRARLLADPANPGPLRCRLCLRHYGPGDSLVGLSGPEVLLQPGQWGEPAWTVPDTDGAPIADVGLELVGGASEGGLFLDLLTWEGCPRTVLGRPRDGGGLWRRAWVAAVDGFGQGEGGLVHRLIQNEGAGLAIQGAREWTDYRVEADVSPHLAAAAGLAARVQGMRRHYALLLVPDNRLRLIKALDGRTSVLAEAHFPWDYDGVHRLALTMQGPRLLAEADGRVRFDLLDADRPLTEGAVALLCAEGRMDAGPVAIGPVEPVCVGGGSGETPKG